MNDLYLIIKCFVYGFFVTLVVSPFVISFIKKEKGQFIVEIKLLFKVFCQQEHIPYPTTRSSAYSTTLETFIHCLQSLLTCSSHSCNHLQN